MTPVQLSAVTMLVESASVFEEKPLESPNLTVESGDAAPSFICSSTSSTFGDAFFSCASLKTYRKTIPASLTVVVDCH